MYRFNASHDQAPDGEASRERTLRVALAGNPNCGKTTLFNALTGARQKVANYPGVTVDSKRGHFNRGGRRYEVIDLPGTYSLTSFSPEEVIARQELSRDDLDAVVVVVDSTNLERNLYLLVQIMEMGANPILCLNMADEARRLGLRIDVKRMEQLLGFPVIETVASRDQGVDRLKITITRIVKRRPEPPRLVMGERLDRCLERLKEIAEPLEFSAEPPDINWMLTKLIESDEQVGEWVQRHLEDPMPLLEAVAIEQERITVETEMDPGLFVAHRRYGFISGLLREVRDTAQVLNGRVVSDRIDEVLCHPLLGLPVFLGMMYGVFWVTFSVGEYPMGWIEAGTSWLKGFILEVWPPDQFGILRSLITDGIIAGVGGVIIFLPNILLLFLGLAFLEDTGYMSRAAFLMDNLLHRFGLHGKSFIPMITGFGCTVPGIMATRTLENERDRLTTMLVLPLISCGARLPIYALLIPAFFPEQYRSFMLWLIYFIGIALAAGLAKLLRTTLLAGEDAPFVMELPPYRMPTLRAVAIKMWDRSWMYLRKAGTVILGISVLLWVLSTFPMKSDFDVDREVAAGATYGAEELENIRSSESLKYSIAGRVGSFIEPVLAPMGFDWRLATGLLGAFAAKEVFVAQMGIVFSLGEVDESSESLRERLAGAYTPLIAFSLLLFLLIATPCMATVAITKQESGKWSWALLQLFQLGSLFGLG